MTRFLCSLRVMRPELSQVDMNTREILVPVHERNSTNWPVLEDGTWPDAAAREIT